VKHPVGAVDDFPAGEIRIVKIGTRSIGIVNNGEKLYAVLNVCPHELAPICEKAAIGGTMMPSATGTVEYGMHNRILRCPWHGYEFDLEDGGRTVFTTFKARVRLFPVSVEDGQVLVEVKDRAATQAPAAA
jgi:nitrite reductase/ring-hydroxylating ferredoxin subunit